MIKDRKIIKKMEFGKYSFGTGDRFGHQGRAQLRALLKSSAAGIEVAPVWNKSNREHTYIHTKQEDTRYEADQAVRSEGTGELTLWMPIISIWGMFRVLFPSLISSPSMLPQR